MTNRDSGTASAQPKIWRNRALWLLVWALLAGVLAYAATFIAWKEVWAALRQANLVWVGVAVLANLCGLPLWAHAIRRFVPSGEPRPFWPILETLAVTVAAIQTLSVFAGGATAAFLFVRRVGLSVGAMISVITLEQVATGIVKALIVGLAVLSASAPMSLKAAGGMLLLFILCALAALMFAAHSGAALARFAQRFSGWIGRALAWFADWTSHLEALRHPVQFMFGVIFTFGRRVMETMAILCIQKACGIPVSVELALFVIAALALATIIPGPPGNIGMYEAAVVVAYGWGGVGAEIAVAAALLQHVAFLIAAMVPGYLLIAFRRHELGLRAGGG